MVNAECLNARDGHKNSEYVHCHCAIIKSHHSVRNFYAHMSEKIKLSMKTTKAVTETAWGYVFFIPQQINQKIRFDSI